VGKNIGHQLSEGVAEALRNRIAEGQILPGDWIRQEHIATEFGISQVPVREALRRLASEGLVEHLPYRGIRVVEVDAADADDLFACRAFAESRAARFAAERLTDDELATLSDLRRRISAAIRENRVKHYQSLNHLFHKRIIEGARRPTLERLLNGLWATHPTMLWPNFRPGTPLALEARFVDDEREHDAILAALCERDPNAAEHAMRHHILTSAATLLSTVERTQGAQR
jgi:DNA-binding GntR family transcriptional regulator